MSYSLRPFLNTQDKLGRKKLYIRVLVDRISYKIPTEAYTDSKGKLPADQQYIYDMEENKVRQRILDALKNDFPISRDVLSGKDTKEANLLLPYIKNLIEKVLPGNMSKSRIAHYKIIYDKIKAFMPNMAIADIKPSLLMRFSSHLSTVEQLDPNTVAAKIAVFKAVINRAIVDKLLPMDVLAGYKNPKKVKKYPVYLTEQERDEFEKVVFALDECRKKTCGYYFLLSCYAGYRISDLYMFDYNTMIEGGKVRLRATKNGNFVTWPIHERLTPVLEYIKDHPIKGIPEQDLRYYTKLIADEAGIKKHVKVHSGRHSFATFLIFHGLSVRQVGEYLGDGKEAAAIYAHLVPNAMDDKVMEIFKKKS